MVARIRDSGGQKPQRNARHDVIGTAGKYGGLEYVLGAVVVIARLRLVAWQRTRLCRPRRYLWAFVLLGLSFQLVGGLAYAEDALDRLIALDIPANLSLDDALIEWGVKAGVAVMMNTRTVEYRKTHGVRGTLPARVALSLLLRDSGLTYTVEGERIRVVPATSLVPSAQRYEEARAALSANTGSDGEANGRSEADDTQHDLLRKDLEVVVVTAEKREERLQDVPVPVSVIAADTLVTNNQLRLQDYYNKIPGLNIIPSSDGRASVIIRGITTANGNPTVGVTVDDVPFGPSTQLDFGGVAPDLDPSDLSRIEVLRGPQGTLYGANSLGGLIKYVTLDPSTDALSGRVEAGTSGVQNGSALGYDVHASVNLPLGDTLAVRASGFSRQTPGYINDVLTGQDGVNRLSAYGGLFSALWRPSDALSLKLSALFQHTALDGLPFVQHDIGPLSQSIIRGGGLSDHTSQAYSATIKAKLGGVDLTAISAYNIFKIFVTADYSSFLGPIADTGVAGTGFNGFGVTGSPYISQGTTSRFTEEIRLSEAVGEHFEWLLGGFYSYEDGPHLSSDVYASVPTTGQVVGSLAHYSNPATMIDEAAFADLTVHITDRFDIQLGGRESENRQRYSEVDTGILVPVLENSPSPWVYPEVHSKDNSFTYLLTPRLRVSEDLMVYARLASGYRDGGPNFTIGNYAIATTYKPDKTQNYEIGVKGDVLDHRLAFDASLYYIQWKDIQLTLINPINGISYGSNGANAKSQGMEISAQAKPLLGLTIAGWIALNDAKLTDAFPASAAAYGAAGDKLPYASRFTGHLSFEQDFPLADRLAGFVGGSVSYVGARQGIFASIFAGTPARQDLPGYAEFDIQTGLRRDLWALNVYVNNVGDRRGVLDAGMDFATPPNAFLYIQPRTVGLSVSRSF